VRPTALREILEGVECLDADEHAKRQFKRLVCEIGATHGVRGIAHAARVNFARHLLEARISRATIRDRLIARYEVSRSQAYAIISDALNCPVNVN
jgi:hypothetical protein